MLERTRVLVNIKVKFCISHNTRCWSSSAQFSAPAFLVHTRLVQCRKRGQFRETFEHSQWTGRVQRTLKSEHAEISHYNWAFCKKNPSCVTLLNDQLLRQFTNLFWIPPLFSFSVASPTLKSISMMMMMMATVTMMILMMMTLVPFKDMFLGKGTNQ